MINEDPKLAKEIKSKTKKLIRYEDGSEVIGYSPNFVITDKYGKIAKVTEEIDLSDIDDKEFQHLIEDQKQYRPELEKKYPKLKKRQGQIQSQVSEEDSEEDSMGISNFEIPIDLTGSE